MRVAFFDGTFDGWRDAARTLTSEGACPDSVCWQASTGGGSLALALDAPAARPDTPATMHVSREFMRIASAVSCHRDSGRWGQLYRVLWRLTHGEPRLMEVATDPEVHGLIVMERAVSRAAHKMKAFVRFRGVVDPDVADGTRYVAWFEPAHHVVERVAPFFSRRFAAMTWSILTPESSVHWDRTSLRYTAGVPRSAAPSDDLLEELWRTYYASIFNPARLNLETMRAEMPQRYWIDLPEARLVRSLAREAPRRVAEMLARSGGPAEELPEELRAATSVADPVATNSPHDPGARVAAARAMRVAGRAPEGLEIDGARVIVGAASWTDPTLTRGDIFYPAGTTSAEERLRFYASRFPFVEVDSTYYALPMRGTVAAWAARTPDHFTFDIKAHALMTGHGAAVRHLPDWLRRELPRGAGQAERLYSRDLPETLVNDVWHRFLDALAPLRTSGKLGAVLLQFPRWFRPSADSAATLRRARERLGDDIGAVEFRNRAWMEGRIADRTLALLRDLDLAYVMVDAPPGTESSMPATVAVTSPRLAVIRLHGRREATWEAHNDPATERYRYLYDRDQLAAWTMHIPDIAQQTQGVHVVCNNCHANYGTTNADEITEMLIEADELRRAMGRGFGTAVATTRRTTQRT